MARAHGEEVAQRRRVSAEGIRITTMKRILCTVASNSTAATIAAANAPTLGAVWILTLVDISAKDMGAQVSHRKRLLIEAPNHFPGRSTRDGSKLLLLGANSIGRRLLIPVQFNDRTSAVIRVAERASSDARLLHRPIEISPIGRRRTPVHAELGSSRQMHSAALIATKGTRAAVFICLAAAINPKVSSGGHSSHGGGFFGGHSSHGFGGGKAPQSQSFRRWWRPWAWTFAIEHALANHPLVNAFSTSIPKTPVLPLHFH